MIGVMQGRLLPKYKGRYQAHPVGYWQEEFPIAKQLGLDCIEFIFDYEECDKNPLIHEKGADEILKMSSLSGVVVKTICADYFMEAPLHSMEDWVADQSYAMLSRLLQVGQQLGITDIVLPCVDQSALDDAASIARLAFQLNRISDLLEKTGINLSLETNLEPDIFVQLLENCDSSRITINYDTGNSASLGYDPRLELSAYGNRVSDVHIKDREKGGGSVQLGSGATNFDSVFSELKRLSYCGLDHISSNYEC